MNSGMVPIVRIENLSKTYASGLEALKKINLDIYSGEIFALLGPNGAGKTTLISIVCGIVTASTGTVHVAGHHIVKDYRKTRASIGLVPQELSTDMFETVWATVNFSRHLFGLSPNPDYIEKILRDLSLWNKRHDKILTLSGGMKRRVLIAKALAHEPAILFLDEPTAGVDVDLRKDMWSLVRDLRDRGVTIILTTHYIEEAEQLADRIGVMSQGQLLLAEAKSTLMSTLGKKQLTITLKEPLHAIPAQLADFNLSTHGDGNELIYSFDASNTSHNVPLLLRRLDELGIGYQDLHTHQRSLEDIFVSLVREREQAKSSL